MDFRELLDIVIEHPFLLTDNYLHLDQAGRSD